MITEVDRLHGAVVCEIGLLLWGDATKVDRGAAEGRLHEALNKLANIAMIAVTRLAEETSIADRFATEINELRCRAHDANKRIGADTAHDSPVHMLLWCPACGKRHVDKGLLATKSHHTHSCQYCGMTFRPSVAPTVGVQFLPGFKDIDGDRTSPGDPRL